MWGGGGTNPQWGCERKRQPFSLLPAPRTGFIAIVWHPDKEDASHKSGASLDQLVDQTQCKTTLLYVPLMCQCRALYILANMGTIHSKHPSALQWEWLSKGHSTSGALLFHHSPAAPWDPTLFWSRPAPELLSASLQLLFQVVSPLGCFKCSYQQLLHR